MSMAYLVFVKFIGIWIWTRLIIFEFEKYSKFSTWPIFILFSKKEQGAEFS